MAFIDNGYLAKRTDYKRDLFAYDHKKVSSTNVFLVKYNYNTINSGHISIGSTGLVYIPKEYIGKRIRLKVEIVDEKEERLLRKIMKSFKV